jgi:hypothetical protein
MSLVRPSVPSTALCPLRKEQNKRNGHLVSRNVFQNAFRQYSKGYRDLFRICDNLDYRNNHDYHSSEILSDNRDNHIQQEAIIVFREKLKTPFRINPTIHCLHWPVSPRNGFFYLTFLFCEDDILPFFV